MANIRVNLGGPVIDGQPVTFRSPANCSAVTGLIVYYPNGDTTTSKTFQFADAHGNNVGRKDLFASDVLVKVILDTEKSRAYVQNSDTNAYLEGRFSYDIKLDKPIVEGLYVLNGGYTAINYVSLTNGDLYFIDCQYNYADGTIGYNKMLGKVVDGAASWNVSEGITEIKLTNNRVTFSNKQSDSVNIVTIAKVLRFDRPYSPFTAIEGSDNLASGADSHVEGFETQATNWNAHAEGRSTIASGPNSHAQGRKSKASGAGSHAEGYETESSGDYGSHAEGHKTKAKGIFGSHAEGQSTTASGVSSHAEGCGTEATASFSHAEGNGAVASGRQSHAEGEYTKAGHDSQHVQGKYNVEGEQVHIVGWGTESKRANIHTIDKNGNAWFKGDVYVGCSNGGVNKDSGSKKLAYVFNKTTAASKSTTLWIPHEGGGYKRELTVAGILSSDTPIIGIIQTGTEEVDELMREEWNKITRITCPANNKLCLYCVEMPTCDLPLQIQCIR